MKPSDGELPSPRSAAFTPHQRKNPCKWKVVSFAKRLDFLLFALWQLAGNEFLNNLHLPVGRSLPRRPLFAFSLVLLFQQSQPFGTALPSPPAFPPIPAIRR